MKIGLFFGTFNPIHIGHLIIANFVANEELADEVWLVVSPHNPFKDAATLLNEDARLALINWATGAIDKIRSSEIEFSLPRPSYTSHTLKVLKERFPNDSFVIILGSDNYLKLPEWHDAQEIIKNDILIYNRPSFEVATCLSPGHRVFDAPLLNISASWIRELIKQNKSIKYLVPDAVMEAIELHGYYK